MSKMKWTSKWLFVNIVIVLNNLKNICANEAISYIPALECYDKYGRPQVRIKLFSFVFFRYFNTET